MLQPEPITIPPTKRSVVCGPRSADATNPNECGLAAPSTNSARSVGLEVDGLNWATEKNVVEATLSRRPGVSKVEANPVGQTATAT